MNIAGQMTGLVESLLSGSKYSAALPITSGIELVLLLTTGQLYDMASNGARPNPSYSEGCTNACAEL